MTSQGHKKEVKDFVTTVYALSHVTKKLRIWCGGLGFNN